MRTIFALTLMCLFYELSASYIARPSFAAEISAKSSCFQDEPLPGPFADLGPSNCVISLEGPIRSQKGDADKLRSIIEELKALPRHKNEFSAVIELSSPGGHVSEAIEIGRIIRSGGLSTMVDKGTCSSACVLVLVSGVSRGVIYDTPPRVGIHSSYPESLPVGESYENTRQRRVARQNQIRAYLREMDIPESLVAAMDRVPSDEIRWLSRRELREFHVTGEDAAWREWRAGKEAARLGISLSEFIARKSRVQRSCQSGPGYTACEERIMQGR